MRNEDRLSEIEAFVGTAHRLSFALAARTLSVSPSAVSRRVANLEERLGARLLERSTRSVRLTEAGKLYLASAAEVLRAYHAADESLRVARGEVRGLLRVAVPNRFGRDCVAPILAEFLAAYPHVDADLTFSDGYVNIVAEGIDLAIRIGELKDSSLVAKRLGTNRRLLCAAPSYLKQHGHPKMPHDLETHSCLNFSTLHSGDIWQLSRRGQVQDVRIRCRLRANDIEAVHRAALGGAGIAILAKFNTVAELRAGQLIRILSDWHLADTGLYALYPSAKFVPAKVSAFVQFLQRRLPPLFARRPDSWQSRPNSRR